MEKIYAEVVRFQSSDVIATSGKGLFLYGIGDGNPSNNGITLNGIPYFGSDAFADATEAMKGAYSDIGSNTNSWKFSVSSNPTYNGRINFTEIFNGSSNDPNDDKKDRDLNGEYTIGPENKSGAYFWYRQ